MTRFILVKAFRNDDAAIPAPLLVEFQTLCINRELRGLSCVELPLESKAREWEYVWFLVRLLVRESVWPLAKVGTVTQTVCRRQCF